MGIPRRDLTPSERRELNRIEGALQRADAARAAARSSFAAFVRAVGIAPAARALGTTPGAMQQRLLRYEGRKKSAGRAEK